MNRKITVYYKMGVSFANLTSLKHTFTEVDLDILLLCYNDFGGLYLTNKVLVEEYEI